LLQESLEQAREQGWALIHNRITPGVTAIGKSFNDSLGQVFGALTVAGLNARMRPERMDMLLDRLASAARMIEHTLRGQRWARYATRL
jgi:DNA-binding IclR family transcriptional regulator